MRYFLVNTISLFQLLSFSLQAKGVEFQDNRIYESMDSAHKLMETDTANSIKILNRSEYPSASIRVEERLNVVYKKAKEKLLPFYRNFPDKPIVVLTSNRNALLPLIIDGVQRTSNIVFISIDKDQSNGLDETIAHELSHYILDHGRINQNDIDEVVRDVSINQNNESIICSTLNSYKSEIQEDLKDLANYMLKTTSLAEEDTKGVPFDVSGDSSFNEILMTELIWGKSKNKISCKSALGLRNTIASIYSKYCSWKGLQRCNIPNDVEEKLNSLIDNFKKESKECLDGEHNYFYETFENLVGINLYQSIKSAHKEKNYSRFPNSERAKRQIEILFSNKNPMDKILLIYKARLDWLNNTLKELNLKRENILITTFEDEADILAEVILYDDNRSDDHNSRNYFSHMNNIEKKYCLQEILQKKTPHIGFMNSIHKSNCWRYWRSIKLFNELKDQSKKEELIQALLNKNLQQK